TRENASLPDRLMKDALSLVALVATAAFSLRTLPRLPERVAMHFNAYGAPDSWAPKEIAAFALPAFALLVSGSVRVSPPLVSASRRASARAAPLAATGMVTMGFICILHVTLLENALGAGVNMLAAVACIVGLLSMALGLIMLRSRRNPLVGIR